MTVIYHMANASAWAATVAAGVYHGTAADRADGFIHFSTAATVAESAAKHRAGERDLLLIAVEAEKLGSALKWEPARGGILFPHLYGPLDPTLVRSVMPLPLGPDNRHIFPELD